MMKKLFFLLLASAAACACSDDDETPAPTQPEVITIDFEAAELGTDGYIWGKPMATEQDDTDWQGNPILSNLYYGSLYTEADADIWTFFSDSGHTYDTWNGFVISNHTDMQTAGYTNDKSVYATSGANGSSQFAVGFYGAWTAVPHGIPVIHFTTPVTLRSAEVANSTYVYLYFRDDVTTEEKPTFTLVATGYADDNTQTGQVKLNLVEGTTISEGWQTMDLTRLGSVTKLEFTIECDDTMAPYYFCLDNLTYEK